VLVSLIGTQLGLFAESPSTPRIINSRQGGLSFSIQFQGRAEANYTGIASTDLGNWQRAGTAVPIIPGLYEFTDHGAILYESRYYRIREEGPGHVPAWGDTYPIEPLSGEETGLLPYFAWQPFTGFAPGPDPGPEPPQMVFYDLNIYEFRTGTAGQLIPTESPLMTIGGIPDPSYQFQPTDPVLRADRVYAYSVNAFIPETAQFIVGNSVMFFCHGSTSQTEEWKRLFELVRILNGELSGLQSKLAANDIVKEVEVIERLIAILQNPELFQEYLTALLNGEIDKLKSKIFSLDGMIQLLDQFAKLIDYLRNYATDLSDTDRHLLKLLGDRVAGLRDVLEEDGKTVSEAWEDFEALIEEIKTSLNDPATYIKDQLQEALVEQLKKQLINHIGKKAAGALVSIALDVMALSDALVLAYQISALAEQANKLLITAASSSSAPVAVSGGRNTTWRSNSSEDACKVTIAYEKLCFKKDGDAPYKGGWDKSPVPFDDGVPGTANGPTSMSGRVGELSRDGSKRVFPNSIDPDALKCPKSAGPCLVYLVHTIKCDGSPPRVRKTFIGVIQCR
ncbi:MAG: coiled-coil domain-containing protein, partial [Verrucomicrobiales bacterium]